MYTPVFVRCALSHVLTIRTASALKMAVVHNPWTLLTLLPLSGGPAKLGHVSAMDAKVGDARGPDVTPWDDADMYAAGTAHRLGKQPA
jgi:hypothetical protein